VRQIYAEGQGPERGRLELVPLAAIEPAGDRAWQVPGVLPAGQRVGLTGSWGLGKSWLALDLAMSVAYGTKFLGVHAPHERGNVVIFDAEGGRARARERFAQIARARSLDPEPSGAREPFQIFWCESCGLGLGRPADGQAVVERLIGELAAVEPKLVVFDTLAKVTGLQDENANASAARVTTALYRLGERLGATVLVLAHPAKSDGRAGSVRGAGEFTADLDVLWSVTEGRGGVRRARCLKDRDGSVEGSEFRFRIMGRAGMAGPAAARERATGAEDEAVRILERNGGEMTTAELVRELAAALQTSQATARRRLQRQASSGALHLDGRTCRLPGSTSQGGV
jgi:hypothetical protein